MKHSRSTLEKLINSTNGRKNLRNPKLVEKQNRKSDLSMYYNKKYPVFESQVYNIIDLMLEGHSSVQIEEKLKNAINPNTQKKFSQRLINQMMITSRALLDMYYRENLYNTKKLHIVRYNRMIVELLNRDYDFILKPHVRKLKEAADLDNVLKALKQKETLLGMHRSTFRVVLNSQLNVLKREKGGKERKEVRKKADIENLTFEEQIELLQLIQKAKRTESEVSGVILKEKKVVEEVVEDIEYEEVVNTDIMETYTPKKIEEKSTTLEKLQRKLFEKSNKVDK